MKRTTRRKSVRNQHSNSTLYNPKLPFIEHIYELRKRLFYVTLSVGLWATGAYFIQHQIVAVLLEPARDQKFIYTTVGGGIDFLFRVCLYTGIACSIPVIVYQILKYIQPLIKKDAIRFMTLGSIASGILALLGMAFGYFFGLPAALHFLLSQFSTERIEAMLSINSYMSFVTAYMLGSAFLFQLPLILVLINRIKPLQPKKLLAMERWVVLLAFVVGGILSPSPRVQDQIMLAGPIIATYQIGVLLVWLSNRNGRKSGEVLDLRSRDEQLRAQRIARAATAQTLPAAQALPHTAPTPLPAPIITQVPNVRPKAPLTVPAHPSIRRRDYTTATTRRAIVQIQVSTSSQTVTEA